jgi:hypothetical protein
VNRFETNTDLVFRWLERRTALRWGMSAGH